MFDKDKIINYIEERHMTDGGYFFARITPSSGLDTYLVVKSLRILGTKPKDVESVVRFWTQENKKTLDEDIIGLFYAISTFKELKQPLELFTSYGDYLLKQLQSSNLAEFKHLTFSSSDKLAQYNADVDTLYLELVESELQIIWFLISTLSDLEISFEKKGVGEYIHQYQNMDGGFGKMNGSQLATTYYALLILDKIGLKQIGNKTTAAYLNQEFTNYNYLEELYWIAKCLTLVDAKIPDFKRTKKFVAHCWREDGGFTRSQFGGITTIEFTYNAISILRKIDQI